MTSVSVFVFISELNSKLTLNAQETVVILRDRMSPSMNIHHHKYLGLVIYKVIYRLSELCVVTLVLVWVGVSCLLGSCWGLYPSKHKTFVSHLYNVGPTSSTLVQHRTNVIQMLCVLGIVQQTRRIGLVLILVLGRRRRRWLGLRFSCLLGDQMTKKIVRAFKVS